MWGEGRSQEDLTSSHVLDEEPEETQFADFDSSRLVHSASNNDLASAHTFTREDQLKAIEDLRNFAKTFSKSAAMQKGDICQASV